MYIYLRLGMYTYLYIRCYVVTTHASTKIYKLVVRSQLLLNLIVIVVVIIKINHTF